MARVKRKAPAVEAGAGGGNTTSKTSNLAINRDTLQRGFVSRGSDPSVAELLAEPLCKTWRQALTEAQRHDVYVVAGGEPENFGFCLLIRDLQDVASGIEHVVGELAFAPTLWSVYGDDELERTTLGTLKLLAERTWH